ncbi:MAG: hypothetical protein LBJ02_00815 [Bifidobacteriaceae bacterium]|jgi:hypothetical protein|nr:hypothetical protein [Bifidobacteriaceae bacterium]
MLRFERLAVVGLAVVAGLIAFFSFQEREQELPGGANASFEVLDVDDGLSGQEAVTAIQEQVSQAGATVFKIAADLKDPVHGRVLYVFGAEADRHGVRGYPDFVRGLHTAVLPAEEMGARDLRGQYVWRGSRSQLNQAMSALQDRGIAVAVDSTAYLSVSGFLREESGWLRVGGICVIGLFVAVSHGTVIRRRRDAILATHGRMAFASYFKDLATFAAHSVATVGAVGVAGVCLLGWYNQWHQLDRFVVWAGGVEAAAIVVVALVHSVTYFIRPPLAFVALLKGQRPLGYSAVTAAAAQVAVLALVFATAATLSAQLDRLKDLQVYDQQWERIGDLVGPGIRANPSEAEVMNAFEAFVLRQDAEGKVLMAQGNSTWGCEHCDTGIAVGEGNTMLVNPEFFERVSVLDRAGDRMKPGEDRYLTLIPEHLAGETRAYVAAGREFAEAEYLDFQEDTTVIGAPPLEPEPVLIADGQEVFAFADPWLDSPKILTDPVIYVLPLGLGIISPGDLFSLSTSDNLLFTDGTAIEDAMETAPLGDRLLPPTPYAERPLAAMAATHAQRNMTMVMIALAVLVLAFADGILVAAYCLRHRQSLFSRLVNGWSPDRLATPLAAGVALGGIAVLAATIYLHWVPLGKASVISGAVLGCSAGICWFLARMRISKVRAKDGNRY